MSSRARNKLSTKQVAALTKDGIYSDGGGLYLRVRGTGRRWLFIGRLYGKRLEIPLGPVLDIALAKARERSAEIRLLLLDGKDPRIELLYAASSSKTLTTFGEFAMRFVDDIEDGFKNPKHRQQWRNTLTTYAKPLFDLPINYVSTDNVLSVLKPIWLSKPETATRVRGRIERILDAAKVKGLRSGENPARGRGHLDLLLPRRGKVTVRHHPALPFTEIAAFMRELRQRPAVAARALEFTILTAARSGEVRGMTWAEVDLDAKLWTVPANRMKAGVIHQVPLSDAAASLLATLRQDHSRPEDYVFEALRGGTLSNMAMAQLLKRMGRPDITPHGFRSSFRDWAGELTQFNREEVEMALAHTVANAVERAYRRGKALEKRRELMAAWADYCGGAA